MVSQGLQAKAVQYFPRHPAIKSLPVLQNKHFVMWSLVAAATGMFMGAGMGGIKGNEDLRDIYDRRTGGGLTEQQVRSGWAFKGGEPFLVQQQTALPPGGGWLLKGLRFLVVFAVLKSTSLACGDSCTRLAGWM